MPEYLKNQLARDEDAARFRRRTAAGYTAPEHMSENERLRAELERVKRENETVRATLIECADVAVKMGWSRWGLCDSIDNSGTPYPSAWLADWLDRNRTDEARRAEAV